MTYDFMIYYCMVCGNLRELTKLRAYSFSLVSGTSASRGKSSG